MPGLRGWRLVLEEHQEQAFEGIGASKFGGRWNHKGYPVVYAGGSASLTVLEVFVHGALDKLATHRFLLIGFTLDILQYTRFQVPDLPDDWRQSPPPESTKNLGTEWLRSGETPVLIVPSAIVPQDTSLIINPRHPDLQIKDIQTESFVFDPRLLG
ncbi:MAG: RES domain-containing protein [Desulfohalobiaceae bacterium]|nr:RES domain-containing protein [Desulfohalobiaceae bacterium]